MENVKLDLNEFLRYGAGGAIFLLIYVLTSVDMSRLLSAEPSAGKITVLWGAAYVLGFLFYSFHRALVYPFIMRINHFILVNYRPKELKLSGWVSELETKLNMARWSRRGINQPDQINLDRWGSHSHMLYVSALAISLGIFYPKTCNPNSILSDELAYAILGAVFSSALISDIRCIAMEMKLTFKT